jgi:hypothetical protein
MAELMTMIAKRQWRVKTAIQGLKMAKMPNP